MLNLYLLNAAMNRSDFKSGPSPSGLPRPPRPPLAATQPLAGSNWWGSESGYKTIEFLESRLMSIITLWK